MKNIVLLLFLFTPLFMACEDEPVPEPEPVPGFDVCMFANINGINMLDDFDFDGTIISFRDELLACGVTLEHNGETYPLEWPETWLEDSDSEGFRVEPYIPGVDETPVMRFGKFELGNEGYHGEEFTIDWGDSQLRPDVVKFDYYLVDHGENGEKRIVTKFWLNGELQQDGAVDVEIRHSPASPTTDYAHFDFYMFVKNAAGENMLDPAVDGNILGNDICVEYDGEIWPVSTQSTRASGTPPWYGLRIEPLNPYREGSPSVLKFGMFPTGNGGCYGEEFTIDWGDGTTNKVKFDCYVVFGFISPITGNFLVPTSWPTKIWVDGELLAEGLHPDYGLAVEIVK